jgi:nitrite reductase (NADH) small subunit
MSLKIGAKSSNLESGQQWQTICQLDDLVSNSGVCALLEQNGNALVADEQVAIFHLPDTKQQIYAIGNYDPIGQANVLYRGIVGSIGEDLVVASPLFKQHFSLKTGQCLQENVRVKNYPVRIVDQQVQLLV